jgi:hypothetical protein
VIYKTGGKKIPCNEKLKESVIKWRSSTIEIDLIILEDTISNDDVNGDNIIPTASKHFKYWLV